MKTHCFSTVGKQATADRPWNILRISVEHPAQQAHTLTPGFLEDVRVATSTLLNFYNRHREGLLAHQRTVEEDAYRKANMWYNAAQWLNHPWILAYTEMARAGPSVDWTKMFSIPQPTTPTFFMEGYAGPSPPLPPSSTDSLLPVTVPTPPLPVPTASSLLPAPTKPTRQAKSTNPVPAAETKSKSKTKSGRRKPEAGSSTQPQSEVTPNDTAAPVQSKKRKGDSIEARPKKTRVVSAEFINSSSDEETLKPKSESLRPVGGEAKAVKPKSQPHFSRMTPSAGFSLIRRPKLDPDAGPPKTAMAALRQAKTAERLANQNAAIAKGNYQLADIPCEACSKRQDRDIVPCAIHSPPQQGSCFTCSTGKTTCTYAVRGLYHAPLIPAGFWSFLWNPAESRGIKFGRDTSQNDIPGDKYSSGMMSFLISSRNGPRNGQKGMTPECNDWNLHY
ncbi:uncharacterized protein LACBIDRAFT_330008 [Laccaria bicolor S238N-H82]|uniref:Predicted protein n=1 Tax=Laccaria bicolor (strain S238N-H82 / ATCC MYA-4686) TaxID=486041 RepID=B0DJW6_LACBS|nr:uncharacterized protein LACBIDRAFT_330008 [Laccaria bicolor S238N-H82]EDR05191.1 predicted protein [Laccaria bicolor S238N-H82]|eukprot:XP_001884156.1 predicted protein [Laccaria bicolor S238N-H82]